jgi:hypothetical protein
VTSAGGCPEHHSRIAAAASTTITSHRGSGEVVAVVLTLSPSRVARALWIAVAVVTLAGAATEATDGVEAEGSSARRALRLLRELFRPSAEGTVGTWLTAGLLLLGAGLLLAIAAGARARGERDAGRWGVLAAVFLFLSCDEAAAIHERVGDWAEGFGRGEGFLLWEWVVPYAVLTVAAAAVYAPFVRRLPVDTRRRVVVAGAVYVLGALVLEAVQARIVDARGPGTAVVAALAVVEEGLEMAGAVLFVRALLLHLAGHAPVLLAVAPPTDPEPAEVGVESDAPVAGHGRHAPCAPSGVSSERRKERAWPSGTAVENEVGAASRPTGSGSGRPT